MFRISSLKLISEENETDTIFDTNKQHILYYAGNSKGKTVFFKVLNYMLGSSDTINQIDGLQNIVSAEIKFIFDDINLYVIRYLDNKEKIKYSLNNKDYISIKLDHYKELLKQYLNKNIYNNVIERFCSIVGNMPTIRSFIFLNYIDENNIGDPKRIFPNAFDYRYFSRIRDTIIFLFNDNATDIANQQTLLKELSKQQDDIKIYKIAYEQYFDRIKESFNILKIDYKPSSSLNELYKIYIDYKNENKFKSSKIKKNLDQLLQKEYELKDELNNITILHELINKGKSKYKDNIALLNLLKQITPNSKEYNKYHNTLISIIEKNQSNLFIFTSSNLNRKKTFINNSLNKLQIEIKNYMNSVNNIDYKTYTDNISIIEICFKNLFEISSESNMDKLDEIKALTKKIDNLKKDFNQNSVSYLNERLNNFYKNNLMEIDFIKKDTQFYDLKFRFDPYKVSIVTSKNNTDFFSGSKARATVLQASFMLIVHEYIQNNFPDLPVLPLLMFDTIDQPFEKSNYNAFYHQFIEYAEQLGIQTILTTKTEIDNVPDNIELIKDREFNKFFDE